MTLTSVQSNMMRYVQLLARNIASARADSFARLFFSIQSDCPHRERFGYGGDAFATAEAVMLNFDMHNFYASRPLSLSGTGSCTHVPCLCCRARC